MPSTYNGEYLMTFCSEEVVTVQGGCQSNHVGFLIDIALI